MSNHRTTMFSSFECEPTSNEPIWIEFCYHINRNDSTLPEILTARKRVQTSIFMCSHEEIVPASNVMAKTTLWDILRTKRKHKYYKLLFIIVLFKILIDKTTFNVLKNKRQLLCSHLQLQIAHSFIHYKYFLTLFFEQSFFPSMVALHIVFGRWNVFDLENFILNMSFQSLAFKVQLCFL